VDHIAIIAVQVNKLLPQEENSNPGWNQYGCQAQRLRVGTPLKFLYMVFINFGSPNSVLDMVKVESLEILLFIYLLQIYNLLHSLQ
jgi:hypothetical protein